MPNINIEVSEELLKAIRVRCAETGVLQKDLVNEILTKEVGDGQGGDSQERPGTSGASIRTGRRSRKRSGERPASVRPSSEGEEVRDTQIDTPAVVRPTKNQLRDVSGVKEAKVKSKALKMMDMSPSDALRAMRERKYGK
jgi:hypothetical protein